MGATLPADFVFEPKVWKDHIMAYFDRKMIMGQLAAKDDTLTGEPGTTINMPFFTKIGAAENPAADEALTVDKLGDNSFNATIIESAKAVGIRRGAIRKSAAARERNFSEAQRQIARVMAEDVDKKLLAEMETSGNFTTGFTAVDGATDYMNINNLLKAKITAFGDKHGQAVAVIMHSLSFLTMMTDSTAGFTKADANDPFWLLGRFSREDSSLLNFEGSIAGMRIFTYDSLTQGATIDSEKSWPAFILKPEPFGLLYAEYPDLEMDYDILNREYVFASSSYFAVKSYHAKVDADDKRVAKMIVTVGVAA